MLNTLIVGASGYTGAELALYLNRHPQMNLTALAVSAQNVDAGKRISDLHPQLKGIIDLPVQALTDAAEAAKGIDVVFLATDSQSESRSCAGVSGRRLRGVRSLRCVSRAGC